MIIVLTATDNKLIAIKIGNILLKQKLIACYNLIPVKSAYWWKGKIKSSKEYLLILKSLEKNFKAIEDTIKKLSSYNTPEIVSVKTHTVNKKYFKWLENEVK